MELKIDNFVSITEFSKGFGLGFRINLAVDGATMYFVEYAWWSDRYSKWKRFGLALMKETNDGVHYRVYAIDYEKNMAYPYNFDISQIRSKGKFLGRLELAALAMDKDQLHGDDITSYPDLNGGNLC